MSQVKSITLYIYIRLGNFAHNVGQRIIQNHAIVMRQYAEVFRTFSLHSNSNLTSTVALLNNSFCRAQSIITNGPKRKKVLRVKLGS